jgi:hypothetical protein
MISAIAASRGRHHRTRRRGLDPTVNEIRRAPLAKVGNLISDAQRSWAFFMWRWNSPHLGWSEPDLLGAFKYAGVLGRMAGSASPRRRGIGDGRASRLL